MAELGPRELVSIYQAVGPEGDAPPLKGLPAIDWSAVNNAYGPSTDTPALIRALMSSNPDHRELADGPQDKGAVAGLLETIADGHPPIATRCAGDSQVAEQWRLTFAENGMDVEAEIAKERKFMAELRRLMDGRVRLAAPYLRGGEPEGEDE